MPEWYEDRENLIQLAQAIQNESGIGSLDTAYFLEKPYKWELEWKYLQLHGSMEGFVEIA